MKTAIYVRVSTEDQAKEGFSINAQKEKLTAFCKLKQWSIYDYYIDEGISAKNIKDRPEINRMLNDVKTKKVKNVLVYKLDRLTRNTRDLIDLVEMFKIYDCNLNSVTESIDTTNAIGNMFLKIVGTFAEFERENLAERVSFGYEQKTREGNYTNTNGVYGYDYIIGKMILKVNILESEYVKEIYNSYLNGWSMQKIARTFNKNKVPTKRGGFWQQSTIKSILSNPLYVGRIRYGVNKKGIPTEYKCAYDKILDNNTFNRVQELMKTRTHFKEKKYPSEKAFFSPLLTCAKCGAKFHPKQQSHSGKHYISYYCNNKQIAKCDCRGVSHNKVLNAFENYIITITLDKDIELTNQIDNKYKQAILKDISNYEVKRKRIQTDYLSGNILSEEYRKFIDELVTQKSILESKLNEFNNNQNTTDYNQYKDILTNLKINWENLNYEEKKSFINQFIKNITLDISSTIPKIKELSFN
ncbi:MAG: recombinase family protein [Bacilli bacterium]